MAKESGLLHELKRKVGQTAPGIYGVLLNLRHGPRKWFEGISRRARIREAVLRQSPFSIDVNGRMGFGAMILSALAVHHHFRNVPSFRKVISTNPLYMNEGESGDLIDIYFERVGEAGRADPGVVLQMDAQTDVSTSPLSRGLSIQEAHEIFLRNYRVGQRFVEEADAFWAENFRQAIGVHFRGSDKRYEAPRIAWETFGSAVDECIGSTGIQEIFIATDEEGFVRFAEARYGKDRVRALDCRYMASGIVPPHFQPGSGREKGREALLTAMILARCSVCVRGPSFLSGFAKILNPDLPVVMLGHSYAKAVFPEVEIAEKAFSPSSLPPSRLMS